MLKAWMNSLPMIRLAFRAKKAIILSRESLAVDDIFRTAEFAAVHQMFQTHPKHTLRMEPPNL